MSLPLKSDSTGMHAAVDASGSNPGRANKTTHSQSDAPSRTQSVDGLGAGVGARSAASQSSGGFDPGWLFVIAGVLMLGATVLVPAADDLGEAQFLRDRAKLIQQHRQTRIDRYREYLNALSSKDHQLVVALAASQLNEIPADRRVVDAWPDARADDASVFPALEPLPLVLPQRRHVESTLMRWTTQENSRIWVIAGGAGLILFGLWPRVSRRS